MIFKRALKHFSKYPIHNAIIHAIGGIGVGFLLAYPVAGIHPVRWGVTFIVIAILGHAWAGMKK